MYLYVLNIYKDIVVNFYIKMITIRRKDTRDMWKNLSNNGVFRIISFESRNLSSVITEILLNYIYRDGLSSRVSCRDTFSPL